MTIPDSVTSIGKEAFRSCSSLTSVTIGSGVTSIGKEAFRSCSSLTSVTIPNSVTSIGDYAFQYCSSLTSVTIGSGVTSMGKGAFYECCHLTSVTIPDSVTSIGDEAFYGCSSLTSVTIGSGVTSMGKGAFRKCYALTSVTIPNSVTSIGDEAFYGCSSLTSVTIGSGVTSMGKEAFQYCSSLTSMTIPDSVTSMGDCAFQYCSSLASVTIGGGVTGMGDYAFQYCSSLTSVTISNGVTGMGKGAFSGCEKLSSVTIPNSVKNIGDEAFCGCEKLSSVTIGSGVTSIGKAAFEYCFSLSSVTIGSGVTSIGIEAFKGCSYLASLTIPSGVTNIGDRAFEKCSSLAKAIFMGDAPGAFGSEVFDECASNFVIHYLDGKSGFTTPTWHGYYCVKATLCTLDMAVSPAGSGTTSPSGSSSVIKDMDNCISATAGSGFKFVKWTANPSTNATFADPASASTTVKLSGNATVTANFSIGAKLTMSVCPDASGTTAPTIGTHEDLYVGQIIDIVASTSPGYHFTGWTVIGGASIDNPASPETKATMTGAEAIVTANFGQGDPAVLTMAASPEDAGATSPDLGEHQVFIGQSMQIGAIPSAGYHFTKWQVEGAAEIGDLLNPNSTVKMTGKEATVTAILAKDGIPAVLTMISSPSGSGETTPEFGGHIVHDGESIEITATAEIGYHFTQWSLSGTALIANPLDPTTTATMTGTSATITANFAVDETPAILTMAVSPANSGSTNPGVGSHDLSVGEIVEIATSAANGYHFIGWTATGTVKITDIGDPTTTATMTGTAATVTANFAADKTPAILTMAVSPANSGSTNPGVGPHDLFVGQVIEINASPADGYHFMGWTATGAVTITDIGDPTTTAVITGTAATITANFAADKTPAILTMAVSPANSGSTNPGAGTHDLFVGEIVEISASPTAGYHFMGWTATGTVTITHIDDPTTTAAMTGTAATVTANFAANETPAILTMAVSPANSGSTNPGVGSHDLSVGEIVEIAVSAADGYHFIGWTATGTVKIADTGDPTTTATMTGTAATVTADFAADETPAILTMAVSPANSGSTNPGAGTHDLFVGEIVEIAASPATGYHFMGWTATGAVTITDIGDPTTTAAMTGTTATVTANFAADETPAALTMAVSPANSGSTNPGAGTHDVFVGDIVEISASPATGYHFMGWTATGAVMIADTGDPTTTAAMTGTAATITANFAADETPAVLTMAVSPAESGSTNPGAGTHDVFVGDIVEISASPATGYHFMGWTATGAVMIADTGDPTTTAAMTGTAATITANFAADETPAVLTMAVSPAESGSTNPGAGTHDVFVGDIVEISASPATGYHFMGWTATGAVTIAHTGDPTTTAAMTGTAATITANFAVDVTPAILTMAVSPAESGSTNPGTGPHDVFVGDIVEISASPADGYHFMAWTFSGNVKVWNVLDATTSVSMTWTAGTVTANFVKEGETLVLTMAASPENAGFTHPSIGEHSVFKDQLIEIIATEASGYTFMYWLAGEGAYVENIFSAETFASISEPATVTAVFGTGDSGLVASGSVTAVHASEVQLEGGFTSKPGVTAIYSAPPAPADLKTAKLKVVDPPSDATPKDYVNAEWKTKVQLYSNDAYKYGAVALSDLLTAKPVQPMQTGDLLVASKQLPAPVQLARNLILVPPSISSVDIGDIELPGAVTKITGMYFGSSAPSVYLELQTKSEPRKYMLKKCGLAGSSAGKLNYPFMNAEYKPGKSCMKIYEDDKPEFPVGYSEVYVNYPTFNMARYEPKGYFIIKNSSGMSAFRFK